MPRPKTEAAEYERLTLRVPKDVMAALRQAAKKSHRALNTEAILLFRRVLHVDERSSKKDDAS